MRAPAFLVCLATASAANSACSSSEVIGSSYRPAEAGAAGGAPSAGQGGSGGAASGGNPGSSPRGSNYDEPYRGQFHFSPPSMWMGTIDGLWFDAGLYHLTYQANPYGFLQSQDEHWAHATSVDLLHWQHRPYALVPGQNVSGAPWAGSVVVDSADSAGFRSGDHPAYVALFTDTGAGTSLAYSNDFGQTWQAYADNPVSIGDADYESNRDPVLTWHEPTQRWVCAYWQDGITFYSSTDLKSWTKGGNVAFGHLVPDLYELEVDGKVDDTRWVLQDASGSYLIGQLDGQGFVADSAVPLAMDVGPGFYASRTSFRQTFPNRRAVQMAWLRSDEVPTAPAQGDATFPVELGLKTFPEGIRLTRTPIAELASLYGAIRHFEARVLPSGQNLLAGIESKTFDLELELDEAATQASEIVLRIADQSLVYDRVAHTLLGESLALRGDRSKLRVLVDRGQLEVFADDGAFSYSQKLAFAPSDASISLTGNGPVALLSADFREVGRTWPGSAAERSRVLDDTSADVGYSGQWSAVSDDPTYFQKTCHVASADTASVEATFTGTRIDWYGLVNSDLGIAAVYLDGALAAEIDCYAAVRSPRSLFSRAELADTFHTIRVERTGARNGDSTGSALVHDYFIYSR